MSPFPDLEAVAVESLEEKIPDPEGFLRIHRHRARHRGLDGAWSPPYPYDVVGRRALDAVAVVPWRPGEGGPEVLLRSSVRPPIGLQRAGASAMLWEIPAGLVEPEEAADGPSGRLRAAVRETHEETGRLLEEARLRILGPPTHLTPGIMAERVWFFEVEVRDSDPVEPPQGDGHPVEQGAELRFVSLSGALGEAGRLDAKTEIALHRLAARVRGVA